MRIIRLTLLLALAFPAAAQAEDATIVSRDVPLGGARSLAASNPPARFNLVGIHWTGPGTVQFRTRSVAGRWTGWQDAAPEVEDLPNGGTPERARRGVWRIGNPWWVGASNGIDYRTRGKVTRLRAFFVWSPPAGVPPRTLQRAGMPAIVPRAAWKADESIVRGAPSVAPALRVALVHHTAGSNSYTAAESPAVVRAIQLYHVKGNGWDDIGYNFLVDKYGQVFEGRAGGIDKNVVGAHAEGFNNGSVGVAVLGEYGSQAPSAAGTGALARLLAWRLDIAHVDPTQTLSFISGGNARFPAGVPVFLRAVAGHRDTGFTDCPGNALYAQLSAIAGEVSRIGLPKLYDPVVTGTVPGQVRFKARLSSGQPWTVDVSDSAGLVVATGSGQGTSVDWTWDATLAAPGSYAYAIRAGPNLLPALGTIGVGVGVGQALAIAGLAADPETVTPNGDGVADATTITYTLSTPANVTVRLLDTLGVEVAVIAPKAWKRAREHAVRFDPSALPDGIYQIEIAATAAGGMSAVVTRELAVTRTLGGFQTLRTAFSPNADGRADRIAFRFALAGPADVRLRILKGGKWVATPFTGFLDAGARTVEWDGTKRVGKLVDGSYEAVVEATDSLATSAIALPFAADTRQPKVRILNRSPLRLWVSEPAKLTLRFGTRRLVQEAASAGAVQVPNAPRLGLVRAVAWDSAGNSSIPVSKR